MTVTAPVALGHQISAITVATLIAAGTFLFLPNIDLWISSLFVDTTGFPLARAALPRILRGVMIAVTDGSAALALVLVILSPFTARARVLPVRHLGFAVGCYALIPGLLVNGIVKRLSGRARPRDVEMFGGDSAFTPVLHPAHACSTNCSFVSGEASALVTVATLAILIVVPALPRYARRPARRIIFVTAALGSGLRIAFGAHFLSDVIFAASLSSLSVLALWLFLGMHR